MSQDHYDKRNEVNTDGLENYIFESEKRRKDKYIAFLFVLIGIVGLYYITSSRQKQVNPVLKDPIYNTQSTSSVEQTPKKSQQQSDNKRPKQARKSKQKLAKHLSIDGFMEANEPVIFTIERFNENATYVLRFNNGKQTTFNQKEIQYTFTNPGHYKASLDVIYKGKTETIAREKFEIMEAIAIAPTASKVDFQ